MALIAFSVDYLDGTTATENVSAFEVLSIRKEFGDDWLENPDARYKITHMALSRTNKTSLAYEEWLRVIGPVTDIEQDDAGKDSETTTEPSQP